MVELTAKFKNQMQELSESELREINSFVVALIKQKMTQRTLSAGARLRVGQRAFFNSRRSGEKVEVTVLKINTKTATCQDSRGSMWRVATTLLQPI